MPDWFKAQPKAMPPPAADTWTSHLPPDAVHAAFAAGARQAGRAAPAGNGGTAGWTKGKAPTQASDKMQRVSAGVVMQHFARSEVRTINSGADGLYPQLVQKLRSLPEFQKTKDSVLKQVIANMTYRMQTADLTINFNSLAYFSAPNDWRTYRQMYDLAEQTSTLPDGSTKREMKLTGNALNPALVRDQADTRVTFGANVNKPDMQGVARFMQTGGLQDTGKNAAGLTTYAANNQHFNPKARQIFAALNYGRRPHGSTTA